MKNIIKKIFILSIFLLVTGCATVQTGHLFHKIIAKKPNEAMVYIYRPDVFTASLINPMLYINGKESYRLPELGYVALSLPLGEHTLETKDEGSFFTQSIISGFKFNLNEKKPHYIRWEPYVSDSSTYYNPVTFVSVSVRFAADIKLISESKAIPEIKQYRKVIK